MPKSLMLSSSKYLSKNLRQIRFQLNKYKFCISQPYIFLYNFIPISFKHSQLQDHYCAHQASKHCLDILCNKWLVVEFQFWTTFCQEVK